MLHSVWRSLLIVILVLFQIAYSAQIIPGLDTFISDQSRHDPRATNDTFLSLPNSLKKSLSSAPFPPLSSLLDYLRTGISVSIPVHVKLVGSFSHSAPSSLQLFISSALSSSKYQVVGYRPHDLLISHSLHVDVSLAANSLGTRIFESVKKQLGSSVAPLRRSSLFPVRFGVVDEIVREDFQKEEVNSGPGIYVYLINTGSQANGYAYSYDDKDSSIGSPSVSKCMGSLWTGTERYIWIDLAAGPVDYGPSLSGEGLLPRGEFHPLATIHGRPKSERMLFADLGSLVLSAYKSLMVPSLRLPVFFDSSLVFRFIRVHGSDALDLNGLNFNSIESSIRDAGLLMSDQSMRFETFNIKYSDCALCSFAISRSTNSFTSRFLFENYTLIVSEYLDGRRLHQILTDSIDEIYRILGTLDDDFARIVPIFVFDLDHDKLLMVDRYHPAVAFKNMVIAVRTRISQTMSDYSCNGQSVYQQARELNRPIVGSILQSAWGVSPTHLSWSPQHNGTLIDYTWSVGQTPFGPFSNSLSLSFVQRDAARRNILLTLLNSTISSTIDVLSSMAAHGGDGMLLKNSNRHVEFVQRWSFFKYKIDKAVSALSHLDYDKSLYYLRSSDHDMYSIHSMVFLASQELEASLVCFNDPPIPWGSASVTIGILFAFFYGYLKRDKLLRNKRKQF